MNKFIASILFICITSVVSFTQVNPNLVEIPADVFVNKGRTDFNQILNQSQKIKEHVKILHEYDELSHDLLVMTNTFEEYWERYQSQWFFIKFKSDKASLLLFKGLRNNDDEREYVEIYNMENPRNERALFSNIGRLLAYKTHPRTGEIILYIHRYPCCKSASHNIYRIRQLENTVKSNDRFFVGRDSGDMVGPFFPEKVRFKEGYRQLSEKTEVRWSPEVIEEGAFENWTESNLMINYEKGAIYKVLYEKDGWQFIVLFSGISEEQSMVLNYTNFKHKAVYGWISV